MLGLMQRKLFQISQDQIKDGTGEKLPITCYHAPNHKRPCGFCSILLRIHNIPRPSGVRNSQLWIWYVSEGNGDEMEIMKHVQKPDSLAKEKNMINICE